MTEDDKAKLRCMLRGAYWEHLNTLRGRSEVQRSKVHDELEMDVLGDFLTYWGTQKDPSPLAFDSFDDAYA